MDHLLSLEVLAMNVKAVGSIVLGDINPSIFLMLSSCFTQFQTVILLNSQAILLQTVIFLVSSITSAWNMLGI